MHIYVRRRTDTGQIDGNMHGGRESETRKQHATVRVSETASWYRHNVASANKRFRVKLVTFIVFATQRIVYRGCVRSILTISEGGYMQKWLLPPGYHTSGPPSLPSLPSSPSPVYKHFLMHTFLLRYARLFRHIHIFVCLRARTSAGNLLKFSFDIRTRYEYVFVCACVCVCLENRLIVGSSSLDWRWKCSLCIHSVCYTLFCLFSLLLAAQWNSIVVYTHMRTPPRSFNVVTCMCVCVCSDETWDSLQAVAYSGQHPLSTFLFGCCLKNYHRIGRSLILESVLLPLFSSSIVCSYVSVS